MAAEMEPNAPGELEKSSGALPTPPPLPPRLTALAPIVYVGTSVWFAAAVVLLVLRYGFDTGRPIWLWTAIAGCVLGLIGVPIMVWQRAASRRGSRTAQRNL